MTRRLVCACSVLLLTFSLRAYPQPVPPLRIVSAGPRGEVAKAAEANEIRVVFSEPMIAMAAVPAALHPAFFHMTPAVDGTFRWSGTTILIFTSARALPLATEYTVTIDTAAAAVSGRRLAQEYTFVFRTPTARLLRTNWYRPGGRYDAAPLVALNFNQPVKPEDVVAHLSAAFQPHPFIAPAIAPEAQERLAELDPNAAQALAKKIAEARTAAQATGPVQLRLATDWDRKRFVPSKDLVVVELTTLVPPESYVRIQTDGAVPSPAGRAVSGRGEQYVIEAERAFFVDRVWCTVECDPDAGNPVEFRAPVKTATFGAALKAEDITDPGRPVQQQKGTPPRREADTPDDETGLTVEDAGFKAQPPATTWLVTLPPTLTAADGQTLGYPWAGVIANWHRRAFTSFGDGHGVWETGGGALLPFYARNFQNVKQWAAAIDPADLMSTVVAQQESHFHTAPDGSGVDRRLGGAVDQVNSHGLDLSKVLKPNGTGFAWAAVQDGQPIEHARPYMQPDGTPIIRSTIVQVTNLGITVKDSPLNTLIFVTRLDDGAPVAGAKVSIVKLDGSALWTGITAADGTVVAPDTRIRDPQQWYRFAFLVTAEKDGDVAYVGSDWNEGLIPWEFGMRFNLEDADPLLRGTVFTDRGVYRLGEEVHLKAILRRNAPAGVSLLAEGTPVSITVRDARSRVVDQRIVKINAWSSADWTMTVPEDGALGNYSVTAILESDRQAGAARRREHAAAQPEQESADLDYTVYYRTVRGDFLVAAYRRPDFRVDVTLTGTGDVIAGNSITGAITARYLFGAPMVKRPTHWTFTRARAYSAPSKILEAFPSDRWIFVGESDETSPLKPDVAAKDAELSSKGELPLTLKTEAAAGTPYMYTLEGDVEDVSRQHIANRASLVVHPAPWYIGVRRIPYFNEQQRGIHTEFVAAALDGTAVPDISIHVTLTQIQWNSVRRAEGNGFYTWDTERKEVPAGSWTVTSATSPVPMDIPLPSGGYFVLEARADADNGRYTVTRQSFYSLGSGYTAWQRYDHNRIDLVPEKQTYRPGETARIMIQSPWERATALLTVEREGIRSHRQFELTSTQQSVEVPITDDAIPDVFVSVVLIKGRTPQPATAKDDPSDPGKPAFRVGYVHLAVEDASKRLTVGVHANKEEYRPATSAKVTVDVKDRAGAPSQSEVTLWAVDYGVLSLTAYRTPDVLDSVYVEKSLAVLTEDTRQRIVSRRVLTPKGDTDGGGGGADSGTGTIRRDFRVLAFWLGSVTTNASGHASVDVKLPESLTTYRIMAVAADKASRFGFADAEIRINKPVTLKAAFPRFLAVGDKASFGAVVTSQLASAGQATVKIESLDPDLMMFADAAPRTIDVPAHSSVEVRFDAAGRAIGRARVRVTVSIGSESDAFEDSIPVEVLASPETVASVGQSADTATERLTIPSGVVTGFGGLHVEIASTALVNLGEGARYLVEYPYGCAEQRGSRALAMLLAADLGGAFRLPGVDPDKLRPTVQSALKELEKFQCSSGGFAYWPGACYTTSPYLTAYLLHVFQVASDLKYDVDRPMRERAYNYLHESLAQTPPVNEGWWPMYTAWQAFAVKVLVEGGRREDSNITRLYGYRDRMPVFALAYLHDALVAKGETSGPREAELRERMANAVLPEAATAHVEELSDPYLLWFWNSNVRSTAIVLNSLVKSGQPDDRYRQFVTWLLQVREKGRWRNTQENALALEALVSYYRRYEAVVPDFTATASLGGRDLISHAFSGRSTDTISADVPMARLAEAGAGSSQALAFSKTGEGTLFYSARFRYAVDRLYQDGLDQGIRIERSYAPYVEDGSRPATTHFSAGDLIRVTLTLQLTKERRFVAVTDPLPAGFEPVESWFASSAASLAKEQDAQEEASDWTGWWRRGGFDRVERHDDRVELFATRLSEGPHTFSYIVRATTSGTFRTAPARAEEMYEPEVFGRTATAVIDVAK
ncbi:MAG TPA: MG2 domain-containing protein [Vicinamibacterales bacterium]|nr:MG2 domain-containing protein [Vicinamibacterales bacterium]